MHYACLVIGDEVSEQLVRYGPYAEDPRFDWYLIGGRFALPTVDGRESSYVLKEWIDFTRLKLPVAIVGEGMWQGVDDPLWSRTGWVDVIPPGWPEEVQAAHRAWVERACRILEALPGDVPIHVVDCHT